MDTKLLDTAGAAERLGLAESTLEKLRVSGDGPPFARLGRSVRYRPSDIDAWTAARVVQSTSQQIAT